MVEPAWFLSTIAQSVAAFIGFLLAFTAALYTNRVTRIRNERRQLWNDMSELSEEYGGPLQSVVGELIRHFPREFTSKGFRGAMDDGKSIDEWSDSFDYEYLAKFCAHVWSLNDSMRWEVDTVDNLTTSDIENIISHSRGLYELFFADWAPFLAELRGVQVEDVKLEDTKKDLIDSSRLRRLFEESHIDFSMPLTEDDTGQNLYSWHGLVDEMYFGLLDCLRANDISLLDSDPESGTLRIMVLSGLLALVGIVLPIALLITTPGYYRISFIEENQFIIQSALLILVSSLSIGLFVSIFQMITESAV